jgi:large subunit ribosomal protein L28
VQRVRALIDGEVRRVKICTRCMKSGKIVKPALSA